MQAPTKLETVLLILTGVRRVVLTMSWLDNPLDVEEVFRVVVDGLRADPGDAAVSIAKSALDSTVIALQAGADTVPAIDAYLDGDPTLLYRRLLFEHGRVGLLRCVDEALVVAMVVQAQAPLPLWIV